MLSGEGALPILPLFEYKSRPCLHHKWREYAAGYALIAENTAWEKQTEEIRTQIIAFLTGTLTLSPETRFQSGNELTDALKRIADDCESFPETQQEKADSVHFEI